MDFTHLSNLFSRPVISGLGRRKWQFIYKKHIKWFSAFVSSLNVKHDISFRLENEKPFGVITETFSRMGFVFIVFIGICRGFAVPSCNKLKRLCVSGWKGIYFWRNKTRPDVLRFPKKMPGKSIWKRQIRLRWCQRCIKKVLTLTMLISRYRFQSNRA